MANLDIIENEKLVDKSADVGAYFHQSLNQRFAKDNFVGQVRGQGMIAAVQLMADAENKVFLDSSLKTAGKVTAKCYENGLIARPLPSVDSVAFSPPLVTTKEEVDQIVDIFETSVRAVIEA